MDSKVPSDNMRLTKGFNLYDFFKTLSLGAIIHLFCENIYETRKKLESWFVNPKKVNKK